MQYAIDSIADPDAIFKRLNMNIGSPELNGFLNHQPHEPDDRCASFASVVGSTGIVGVADCLGKVDRGIGELRKDGVSRRTFDLAVHPVDRQRDAGSCCQGDGHITIEDEPEFFNGINITRLAHEDF